MKKILKCLAAGFALCFGLFAFTACGDGQFSQANVNTNGNYTACNASDVAETVNIEELQEQNFGYKTTMKINGTGYMLNSTIIATVNEEGTLNTLAGKMVMDINMGGSFVKTNTEIYAPNNGYIYSNSNVSVPGLGAFQTKIKTNADFYSAFDELTNGMENINVVQGFLDSYSSAGVTLEKAEVGNQTKFHLVVNDNEINSTLGNFDTNIWIVFEGGNFVGAKLEGKLDASSSFDSESIIDAKTSLDMNFSVEIVPFEGEIVLPGDLANYKEDPSHGMLN